MAGKPGQKSTLPFELPARYERGCTWDVDQRSRPGRETAAARDLLLTHLGGPQEISVIQLWLIERAVFAEHRLREHESAVLKGEKPLMSESEYQNAVGQFSGLCTKIGLRRVAKRVPTLQQYLASKSQDAEQAQ